ncbi:MAG: ABC transporter permease subunit, partial [Chitinophagaceae bacterium]
MKTLLLLEWLRLRKYKTFWVFIILFVVSLVGINYILHTVQTQTKGLSQGRANFHIFSFPQAWSTTAWAGGLSVLLLGLLTITLVTNEYSFKTHRQQIIDGISRKGFISEKWLTILILAIFTWIIYFFGTIIIGVKPQNVSVFNGFYYAGYFFVKTILSLSVAFMFALLFKRSSLAIALY